jgi:hypothetical protein
LSVINPDFESLRTALINSYNSQTTNHAGYVIALIVGIFVLISSGDLIKLFNNHKTWFLFALSLPISLIEYFGLKIVFWAWMSSEVLTVTEQQALNMNKPTIINGIQAYLIWYFTNNIHGFNLTKISSVLYGLDQKVWFGSFFLLFILTFLFIYIFFGFWKEYHDKISKCLLNYAKNNTAIRNTVRIIVIIVIILILYLLTLF